MKKALALSLLVVLTRGVAHAQFSETVEAWGNGLHVQLEPTSDPAEISAAVDKLASRTANAGSWLQEFYNEIDSYIASKKMAGETPTLGEALAIAQSFATRGTFDMNKQVTVKLDVTADSRVSAISVGVMDEASSATGFALVKLDTAAETKGSTE